MVSKISSGHTNLGNEAKLNRMLTISIAHYLRLDILLPQSDFPGMAKLHKVPELQGRITDPPTMISPLVQAPRSCPPLP